MGFSCGIVGLPNVGKSTIFNALTHLQVPAEAFPFCTIEPNLGKVPVPDNRLYKLAQIIEPQKLTPATMEFVDIAGLVRGASKGEGLGNQFLGHIRSVQAIAHIVRCFSDENVAHVSETIDPVNDIDVINLELILADLDTVEKRLDKLKRMAKVGDKAAGASAELLQIVQTHLQSDRPARFLAPEILNSPVTIEMNLLTAKPSMYVLNVSDDDLQAESSCAKSAVQKARTDGNPLIVVSGKIEAELNMLSETEQMDYRKELGLADRGLDLLIQTGYRLLELITFYTTAGVELRAWTVTAGTRAPAAAGKIHTDMERGFIRADVYPVEDIFHAGSETKLKEAGRIRSEGKEYIVQDGDVIRFKFNV